jgi:hypothetical protein
MMKFLVLKDGFDLKRLQSRQADSEDGPHTALTGIWKALKPYLEAETDADKTLR